MGWQDRDYGRDKRLGDMRFSNPIMNLLFGSIPLGSLFGIKIRIHSTLIVLILARLLFAQSQYGYGMQRTAIFVGVLFTIILLHEFGHCFASRWMGGHPDEILLWPLGGLAYANPPHNALASFVCYAGGPMVNVLICAITGTTLFLMGHMDSSWLNPFIIFGGTNLVSPRTYDLIGPTHIIGWLFWFFTISWGNLMFNLLPIFPLDGGGLLHGLLWKPFGYRRAMNFSCITGMIGAGIGGAVGVFTLNLILVALAIAGFMTCRQMRMSVAMSDGEDAEQYDLSAAWENPEGARPRHRKLKKRWFSRARKRATQDQAEQARIDAILAKVKEKGLHSLSWWEKRALRKATERQRQQDLAQRR